MIYYFIGIKGTGMASLARLLNDFGLEVLGSDIEKHTFTQVGLEADGIQILPFDPENIKPEYTVVKGNAFDDDFPEVVAARKIGAEVLTYPQTVQKVIERYVGIGIAGAHGKTTTTAMMSHVLSSIEPTSYLVGDGVGKGIEDSKYFVFEADEYRRHFIDYKPNFAVVTNVDFDHPDYYQDENDVFSAFQEFTDNVKDTLFVYGDDPLASKLRAKHVVKFGIQQGNNNFFVQNVVKNDLFTEYDVWAPEQYVGHVKTQIAGDHGIIDSLAVFVTLYSVGFDPDQIALGIQTFAGAKRRFNIKNENGLTYIDDYAHHPNEISTTIQAARQKFPDKKLVAIFQPHTFSRVEAFGDEYAKSLSAADSVYLTPIFGSAREADGNASSDDIGKSIPNFQNIITEENARDVFEKHRDDVLIFMGAGDIEKYEALLVK
ncbi:MAG: UDP-N-acetylmuramate--L-alanine ligase [Lactobacillaceae bacterium]|jgi:UDP-N-acetylmuramate--alanine ligase|nr:UDP-N-acetylmuramate--L-alanine ligase [Lactobacillaceae bacterium]